jgi:hypothetical protein
MLASHGAALNNNLMDCAEAQIQHAKYRTTPSQISGVIDLRENNIFFILKQLRA